MGALFALFLKGADRSFTQQGSQRYR